LRTISVTPTPTNPVKLTLAPMVAAELTCGWPVMKAMSFVSFHVFAMRTLVTHQYS
jgi:hypothetical protein